MKKEEITISEVMNKYRLEDLHGGNEQLFADIMTAFSGPLKNRISQILGPRDRAIRVEDVVQDTMLLLWKYKESLENFSALWTYVARIAHNQCLDKFKSNDNKTEFLSVKDAENGQDRSVENQVEHKLALARIYMIAKKELAPTYHTVFIGHYFGEMTHTEIARKNGIAVATSRANLSRAWDKLGGKLALED